MPKLPHISVLVLPFLALALLSPAALAIVSVQDFGFWPESWPKELEPLRKEARTIGIGTGIQQDIYEIRFNDRTTFERYWPLLSQQESKGGLLTLYKVDSLPPKDWGTLLSNKVPAVRIYTSPHGAFMEPGLGKRLEVGSPWPSSALLPNGQLPEYVRTETVDGKMTWVPAKTGEGRAGFLERARVDVELVVDGNVIDLNRISFPADTPVIDKRWSSDLQKSQKSK